MEVKNVGREDLYEVLDEVNKKYKNNLKLVFSSERGNKIRFTIGVRNSKGPGARRSISGRRLPNACWHAYGHFIDKLFEMYPKAKLEVRGNRYNANNWRWEDIPLRQYVRVPGGSTYVHRTDYMSQLCDCER